jgi:hypothetical protein
LLIGLVGYWKLDESSGNATDYSSNGNTGTATSITYSVTGKINTAYQFDGSNSKVDMGNTSSLSLTSTGTVNVWIYQTDNTNYSYVVSKENTAANTNGYSISIDNAGANVFFELADASSSITGNTGAISANAWHMITMSWGGDSLRGWIDNVQKVSVRQTITPVSNVKDFWLGVRGYDGLGVFFTGIIDECGVWNRGLKSAGVDSLYNATAGKAYPFSLLFPIRSLKFSQSPKSEPTAVIVPMNNHFADLPKNKIAA